MSLDTFLREKGVVPTEGYSQQVPAQARILTYFAKEPSVQRILEIGFNAGHSAELFLQSNPNAQVVSFDLGVHPWVQPGKEYIDKTYPGRHTLIVGNSVQEVPAFQTDHSFDLIFIDGGHDMFVATADLLHCKRFARKDTLVLMDDTMNTPSWTASWNVGPTQAWKGAVQNGVVVEKGSADYERGRGMSWGHYRLR